MYQTALDALIYPAEINTISLGYFLDGHAQVKPGIDPLGLLVRQLHHRSIELIAELLVLQDFFRGRRVLHHCFLNAIVAVQRIVRFVVMKISPNTAPVLISRLSRNLRRNICRPSFSTVPQVLVAISLHV